MLVLRTDAGESKHKNKPSFDTLGSRYRFNEF